MPGPARNLENRIAQASAIGHVRCALVRTQAATFTDSNCDTRSDALHTVERLLRTGALPIEVRVSGEQIVVRTAYKA